MKFQVITGIFEGTIFEGIKKENRIINLESIGQSYPLENCEIYELFENEIVGNKIVVNKIECVNHRFFYGCRLLNRKNIMIKGGKGAGGMLNANEFNINNTIITHVEK